MSNFIKFSTLAATSIIAVSTLSPIAATPIHADSKEKTVTVGLVGSDDLKLWKEVAKTAKDKYNINVKTKTFTDYNQPNKAVADGSIDLNAFQHKYFLSDWNKHNGNKVKAIGDTSISPMRVYANSAKKVTDFKKGDTIALPNDPTNEGRALQILQSAGVLKLKNDKLPTTKDIKQNKLDLKFKELSADQVANAYRSKNVQGAVINTNYAQEAKINLKSAIYVEPLNKDSKKWVNVIAAKKSKANDDAYKKVVKAYQSKATKQEIKHEFGDTVIPAWDRKFQ
ncbi:D-methionine transport system substrate-binding protein [Weissella uvarum]|uniref:MetQ/NlpA family ABC transporter substrate-binding protein n=1 Tax=Weissella uvarum TaxID=1479233 RepID=UPI0019604525|nr:MetQ/NlpA family ABC transporter substrate-binding protein [Weissella uvarum]MBM7616753.1 D-methionine transport system substrate-binding protein [Weissella uvarum]MCM0594793.1 MetQ/NlpA family ABC transporter substrate-binding protein [Weissella uvarum]